jgi:predicted nucleotide-binding protein
MFDEKAEDLLRSDGHTIENGINSFLALCESDSIMHSVTQPLRRNKNVDILLWYDNFCKSRSFILPTNDDDKLALLYQLLLKVRSNEIKYYNLELGGRDINQAAYQFNNAVSRPLIRGLSNEIDKMAVSSQTSPRSVPVGPTADLSPDPQNVFVVYGRNEKLRLDFFSFLRSLGLKPIEFSKAVTLTGKGAPYIGEILDAAFRNAQAVIVLMSPDDEARLKEQFQLETDESYEKELVGQPRQNVFFEAGLAFGHKPDRTILVKVGELRPFSDVYGRHEVRLTNDPAKRQDLVNRLEKAGCVPRTDGTDWLTIGEFESISSLSKKASVSEARPGLGDSLGMEIAPRIDMQEAKRIALEQVRLERPESENAKVDSTQLVGKSWVISGYWTESGPKSYGSTNFEVVIDSVTKEISKVSFTPGFAMAVG